MADVKISALPAATTPLAGTEVLPIVQSSTTKKVSVADLTAGRAISGLSIATTTGATFATSSGSVGIGTSSPSYTLDVLNSASSTLTTRIKNSNASGLSGILFDNNTSTAGASVAFNSSTNLFEFWTNSDNGFRWGYAGSSSSFTERMRIDASGNVGIGTSSPSASGTGGTSKVLEVNGGAGYGILNLSTTATANGSTSGILQFCSELGSDDRLAIISAVKDDASASTPKGYLYFGTANAGGVAERMRITSAGRLGVGTSNPDAQIDSEVSSGAGYRAYKTTTGGFNAFNFYTANENVIGTIGISSTADTFYLGYGTTPVLTWKNTGIVSMPSYGAGAATFDASGVISSVSDETWKVKDGVPTNTDAMLQKLEPGYWFYNDEKKETFSKDRQLGFYAQNVHEAIGEEAAPTPEEGKPWGYYDRSVLAVVVMSLKNALNTIEELKQRIATLENK
jgi:hypothetical protein